MPWTRPRLAIVACAAVSALAMLYVGLFQISWLAWLACPGFGSGCASVALAPSSYPLGLAEGLLLAASGGLICALVQMKSKEAAAVVVVLAFVNLIANFKGLLDMQKLGAYSLWGLLCAALALPVAALAPRSMVRLRRLDLAQSTAAALRRLRHRMAPSSETSGIAVSAVMRLKSWITAGCAASGSARPAVQSSKLPMTR